jgi:nucleoside-diphosphate-sugar epimerase
MRVLLFGATGYLGGRVAAALLAAGHEVIGLVRSSSSSPVPAGVAVLRGELSDPADLARAVTDAEPHAVAFCARVFDDGPDRAVERRVIEELIDLLHGSDRALVFTSGTGVLSTETGGLWADEVFAEADDFVTGPLMVGRRGTEELVLAADGVRGIVVRPPSIWGRGLSSHTTHVVRSVLERGEAWYVGPGLNSYAVVHVDDLAELYRLAIECGTAGRVYHATAGEVPNRWLAEVVGDVLGAPARSVTPEQASDLWGDYVTRVVMGSSSRTTSAITRAELGWTPTRTDMLADTRDILSTMSADPTRLAAALARRPV